MRSFSWLQLLARVIRGQSARFYNEAVRTLGGLWGNAAFVRYGRKTAVVEVASPRLLASEAPWFATIRDALARQDRPEAMRRWRELVKHCPASTGESLIERQELRTQLALSSPALHTTAADFKRWLSGTVVCEDPVIILSASAFFETVEYTAPYYKDRSVYFFMGVLWTLAADPYYRQKYKETFDRLTAEYPNFKITVLANDAAELLQLRDLGIRAELVNHNAFVDDAIFDILPVEQTFDAVYNARLEGYKRHHLAQRIKSLKLIVTEATEQQCAEAKRQLPGCTIANQQGDEIVYLGPSEVARHLNTAKCGLCLSSHEGAMFASIEYLLCGLPVVTTRSAGGRDWFFSSDYVIYCDEDAAAVADAVERIIRVPVSRRLVRESTRQKMRRDRLVFFDLVDRVFRELGFESRRIEPEFTKIFTGNAIYTGRQVEYFLVP